jgi:hypothetical protein
MSIHAFQKAGPNALELITLDLAAMHTDDKNLSGGLKNMAKKLEPVLFEWNCGIFRPENMTLWSEIFAEAKKIWPKLNDVPLANAWWKEVRLWEAEHINMLILCAKSRRQILDTIAKIGDTEDRATGLNPWYWIADTVEMRIEFLLDEAATREDTIESATLVSVINDRLRIPFLIDACGYPN